MPIDLMPRKFFVTSGTALSDISEMNAFDQALVKAGIAEANLVPVSSILPKGIRKTDPFKIKPGTITFCVLSKINGAENEMICAGLAYGFRKDGMGGYVAEGQNRKNHDALKKELCARLSQMANHRGLQIEKVEFEIAKIKIPDEMFGSCVVALVFS